MSPILFNICSNCLCTKQVHGYKFTHATELDTVNADALRYCTAGLSKSFSAMAWMSVSEPVCGPAWGAAGYSLCTTQHTPGLWAGMGHVLLAAWGLDAALQASQGLVQGAACNPRPSLPHAASGAGVCCLQHAGLDWLHMARCTCSMWHPADWPCPLALDPVGCCMEYVPPASPLCHLQCMQLVRPCTPPAAHWPRGSLCTQPLGLAWGCAACSVWTGRSAVHSTGGLGLRLRALPPTCSLCHL